MRSFFELMGFEYKKMLMRKSAVIALVLVTFSIVVSPALALVGHVYVDGKQFETYYQAMVRDRTYARALSGRSVDNALVEEVKAAYAKVPIAVRYATTPEYQQYARAYSGVFNMVEAVYQLNMEALRVFITSDETPDFYQTRDERIQHNIQALNISEASKDKLLQWNRKIAKPLIFAYHDGYERYFAVMLTTGIFTAFALAICLAPMFAGEYGARMDQLILSSKLGKSAMISAKLCTAISFSVLYFLLMAAVSFLSCMLIYGFDGANAAFQLILTLNVYPLTMLQAAAAYTVCVFSSTILTIALTLLLSSKIKSPFGVIIIISVLLFVPMMLHVSENNVWLYRLFSLLPSSMMGVWSVYSHIPYEFFNLTVSPYIFFPIFAIIASAVMLPFARKAFRNHQVL